MQSMIAPDFDAIVAIFLVEGYYRCFLLSLLLQLFLDLYFPFHYEIHRIRGVPKTVNNLVPPSM